MLKKMFKIGMTNILSSITPILVYFLLSFMYKNQNIKEGFTIAYPFQFILMALYNIFVIGQLKGKAKDKDIGRTSYFGIIVFFLIGIIIIFLSYILRIPMLGHFNHNAADYTEIFIYSLSVLVMDYAVYTIITISQYEEKHKKAFLINILWYASRVMTAFIIPLYIKDYHKGLLVILSIQCVIFLLFACLFIRIKKISLNIRDGIKYSLAAIPSNIFLTIIYFTGYGNASTYPGYFEAYNLTGLCTDTQWDILNSGIDTAVSIEVCKDSGFKLKKAVPGAELYSIIMFLSSAVMFFLYSVLNPGTDISKSLVIYLIECGTFPVYAVLYSKGAKLTITSPSILISILTIMRYILRISITLFVKSPYAISFGVPASCIFGCISWFVIWPVFYKNRKDKQKKKYPA